MGGKSGRRRAVLRLVHNPGERSGGLDQGDGAGGGESWSWDTRVCGRWSKYVDGSDWEEVVKGKRRIRDASLVLGLDSE